MSSWAGTKYLMLSQSQAESQADKLRGGHSTASDISNRLCNHVYCFDVDTRDLAFVVSPKRKTLIMLHTDLYYCALHIQQSVGNINWILHAGVLHIAFAALHALGKTVDGSDIDTCAIETGIYMPAALCVIYGGKVYKPDMVEIFKDIQSWYSENLKPHQRGDNEHLAEFLIQYLKQVESLLYFISICRLGDWEGYLAALENIIKCFFARDLFTLDASSSCTNECPGDGLLHGKHRRFCCGKIRSSIHLSFY